MPMLKFYQIIILFIAVFMIYGGIERFIRHQSGQTLLKLGTRLFVWGGMAIVVVFPSLSNTLASLIGIEGNVNAVILTGFILVFLIIFKLLSAIERLEQQMTILTRNESISHLPQSESPQE